MPFVEDFLKKDKEKELLEYPKKRAKIEAWYKDLPQTLDTAAQTIGVSTEQMLHAALHIEGSFPGLSWGKIIYIVQLFHLEARYIAENEKESTNNA